MVKLIAEGGVAGHLAHLYDNRGLTFEKLAEILTAASKGKLVGTEKTDGFNIYLGFKNGEAKAARNKGDMQKGGMNAVDLAMREFAGGEDIKKVYVDAFNAFEAAVASLSDEEKLAIFGPEGEIFYNSEIMGPGASNVVNYDSNIITIHGSGHKRYDEETDKVVNADVSESSKALDKVVDRFEQATQGKNFNVQRTAFVNLQKLEGNYDLKIALEKIKKAGLQGNMTVQDFLAEKLLEDINEKFPSLNDDIRKQIVNRILKAEGAPTLTQIYRGLGGDKNLKEQVKTYVQTGNKTISRLIWPIEEAIHDFAVAMLENMESAYVLDNAKELDRLKKEVQTAIKSIQAYQGAGQEMAHEILAKQLRKIKNLDNITSVAEGFVFEYDGQLYKFTGNFAPINQILGLFRFGRKGVKIPRVNEAKGVSETVAIVPGAFKPPHRGHLDMVRHYADNADRVIVMVSPKPRQTPSGVDISQQDSIAMWNLYLEKLGLKNIEIIESPHPSPVRSAYEYVEKTAEPGEMVVLGTSTKGGDQSRFAKNVQQYAKEGVRVLDPMKYAFDPIGEELSATDFRAALESGELATAKFLPNGVSPEDVLEILGIKSETEEVVEHITLPIFFRLIKEALDEDSMRTTKDVQDGYKKQWQRAIDVANMGANKETGGGKGIKKGDPKLKSAPAGGGAMEEGIVGETWYFATNEDLSESLSPMYLTLNKHIAEMMGENVYAFRINPESVWHKSNDENSSLSFDIDTIGHSDINLSEAGESFDVLWDPTQFSEGFETIFVVNPSVLEISSMAGGSVEGYAMPLGAQPKRKKKKIPPYMEPHMHQDEGKDPKKGTGKKPKGSGRRLYTDEDPSDTVSVKFSTVQDIKDTLSKASFKSKSHKRQSQIINLIHQRVRAAYNNAKDPKVKSRLKKAYDYAKKRKEASKEKTKRMNKSK